MYTFYNISIENVIVSIVSIAVGDFIAKELFDYVCLCFVCFITFCSFVVLFDSYYYYYWYIWLFAQIESV